MMPKPVMPKPVMPKPASQLTAGLKHKAEELGFPMSGVCLAAAPGRLKALHRWLDNGYAGQMHYLENRREAYSHPSHVLDGCRSLLMLGFPYQRPEHPRGTEEVADGAGRVARYARGQLDYHDLIHARLKELKRWLQAEKPGAAVRGVVDTAPLLEREFAQAAGVGWVGKNTLLLNRGWGSYFFLAALLTDLELQPDAAWEQGHCGTCTACLDQCPTKAFPEPYVLDATRCISYLTIEHRGPIDSELAESLDDWVFGCDICQEVCPWNRKAEVSAEAELEPRGDLQELPIREILQLDEPEFRRRFRRTPLWRTKRRGMLRNAILIAGNQRLTDCTEPLCKLLHDEELLLRAASAWALARIQPSGWRRWLERRLDVESEQFVIEQLEQSQGDGTR